MPRFDAMLAAEDVRKILFTIKSSIGGVFKAPHPFRENVYAELKS